MEWAPNARIPDERGDDGGGPVNGVGGERAPLVSRYRPSKSRHYLRVVHGGWVGLSEWDVYYPNSRLRWPRSRRTLFSDEKSARRWARKYKVEFPTKGVGYE